MHHALPDRYLRFRPVLHLYRFYLRVRLALYRFNSRLLAIYWRWKYPVPTRFE